MEDNEQKNEASTESHEAPQKAKKSSPIVGVITTVLVIAIAGAAGYFLMGGTDDNNETVNKSDTSSQTTPKTEDNSTTAEQKAATSDQAGNPTKEQVALHDNKDDCWTIVSGKVYDITKYIPRHPGGNSILEACGTDGTSLFTERKTADGEKVGSGTPHSSMAENQLKQYEVGTLAN